MSSSSTAECIADRHLVGVQTSSRLAPRRACSTVWRINPHFGSLDLAWQNRYVPTLHIIPAVIASDPRSCGGDQLVRRLEIPVGCLPKRNSRLHQTTPAGVGGEPSMPITNSARDRVSPNAPPPQARSSKQRDQIPGPCATRTTCAGGVEG